MEAFIASIFFTKSVGILKKFIIFAYTKHKTMKATVKQIFNEVSYLNPVISEISSLGCYVSQSAQIVSDSVYKEIYQALPQDTLAFKILTGTKGRYSEKQLWVITFELEKNETYALAVGTEIAERNAKIAQKEKESKAKLAANKDASADILATIKAAKKLGEFGKWLNTSGNQFRKEHFSKKYTQASVNAFLQTL